VKQSGEKMVEMRLQGDGSIRLYLEPFGNVFQLELEPCDAELQLHGFRDFRRFISGKRNCRSPP
jgi:hypothetical protein